MRRIIYGVATSLDGYLAGPSGEIDWIVRDPDIDFAEIYSRFDTVLVGRRTFETMIRVGRGSIPGMEMIVFSRTLRQEDYPGVTIAPDLEPEGVLADLRSKPGKDIWLFGGGSLFRSLVEARLVDTISLSVMPVLLAEGIPLLPPTARWVKLRLVSSNAFKTGIMSLEYDVEYGRPDKAPAPSEDRSAGGSPR